MSTRLSQWVVLTAIALAIPGLGRSLAQAQVDAPDAANLYPGRFVARCTPAPIIGCACTTQSPGEVAAFPELASTADPHPKDARDSEYLHMIAWVRRTCASLTQPASPQ
jgi:hypothetical protein